MTPYYDPMIAKLIAHADDRGAALEMAADALDNFVIETLTTNRVFLSTVLRHPAVQAGEFDTGWLERFAKGKLD